MTFGYKMIFLRVCSQIVGSTHSGSILLSFGHIENSTADMTSTLQIEDDGCSLVLILDIVTANRTPGERVESSSLIFTFSTHLNE